MHFLEILSLQHYVDLNEPYLRVNTEYMKRNQTDYLSLMGSPDEMAPPPPRYVNGHVLPEIRTYRFFIKFLFCLLVFVLTLAFYLNFTFTRNWLTYL